MGMTKCHATSSIAVGSLQLIIAGGVIISAFVFSSYGAQASHTPYWLGFPYILPALSGITGGITKNQCCMVTSLVLNILATIVAGAASVLVTAAWLFWNTAISLYQNESCYTKDNACVCGDEPDETYYVDECSYLDKFTAILIALAMFCYISWALALAGSIVGCMATCCAPPDPPTVVLATQPYPPGVVISNSTTMTAPGQVVYPPGAYEQQRQMAYMPTHDKAPLVV